MAAEMLGVDYKDDNVEYAYELKKTTHNDAEPHFGTYK
jgi:hypothetical protein